ncbi:MAG: hypothetical protein H6Q15_2241 [Bacteroidetes bacterium]|nr:hypothetical protein [Bacteroidota bacterium]
MSNVEANILILSDLHCCREKSRYSRLYCGLLDKPVSRNPVEAFKQIIEKEHLHADYVICLGDVTDKADQAGFIKGKDYLNDLTKSINAKELFLVTGNHDVDPMNVSGKNDYTFVLRSTNNYPLSNSLLQDQYWGNNFCTYEDDKIVALIINTCTHLQNPDGLNMPPNIGDLNLCSIKEAIGKYKDINKIKITLFHHHPLQHSDIDDQYTSNDLIDHADKLIQILKEMNFHLIAHGHKHLPRLKYDGMLPVFCSGSFSSLENVEYFGADNTVHLMNLSLKEDKCVGIINTWKYNYSSGWLRTKDVDAMFPAKTGFGFNGNAQHVADEIVNKNLAWYNDDLKNILDFKLVIDQFPEINYFSPYHQKVFSEYLLKKYKLEVLPDIKIGAEHLIKQVRL